MMLRIEPGYDREVVGKRQRWIAGQHPIRRPHALFAQRQQVSGVVALCVVPAKSIQRNQHHVMLLLGPRRVGSVIDMRKRKSRIEARSLPRQRAWNASQAKSQQQRANG